MTTLETILAALAPMLEAALAPALFIRNADRPEEIPVGGLAILRDGSTVEFEAMLSPLRYVVVHEAELFLAGDDEAARDALLAAAVAALEADRTLGGLTHWLEPQPPDRDLAEAEGADAPRTLSLAVRLHFEAASLAA